jgi:hypothetical protein
MDRRAASLFALVFVGCSAYVVCAALLAASMQNPHLLNRFGALLAAIGAGLLIWQMVVEVRLHRAEEEDTAFARSGVHTSVDAEVILRVIQSRKVQRESSRRGLVIALATIMLFSELIHGWGDLAITLVLGGQATTNAAESSGTADLESCPKARQIRCRHAGSSAGTRETAAHPVVGR